VSSAETFDLNKELLCSYIREYKRIKNCHADIELVIDSLKNLYQEEMNKLVTNSYLLKYEIFLPITLQSTEIIEEKT
jgi:hypothetical protein